MNKKPVYAILVLLLIPILLSTLAPVSAWQYQDGTAADTKYETFGPRADRMLIKLYADAEAEWDALEAGEIDITDWPLSEPYYDRFTTPPQNASIGVESYGPELGMFLLDINNNPNEFLGNPQDSAYPNPVWPNNPTSCVNMRQAIWYLTDRDTWGDTYIGTGFYYPLLSTHPESFGAFAKPMSNPYPYSPAQAILKLESDVCPADGAPDFPMDDGSGYRYHDLDGDGVYDDPEERLEIRFAIRSDHYHRNAWGEALTFEMESINIRVDARYGPPAVAYDWWFFDKEVHLYTAGWSLGVDPDHTVLWESDYYWHPGFCYNTGYVNDAILDDASQHVTYANDASEALTYCYIFQDRFAEIAGAVPWWSYSGAKAVRRRYTGGTNEVAQGDGEDGYRGNYWDGIINRPGYGIDDFTTFLNMHPRGFERGNCSDMTIRWAFKVAELKSFNPVYSEWLWEWNILGLIYDSLLGRSPYDNNDIRTNMAESYEVGTYAHPVYGTCTKIKFTLKPGMTWADGMPVTVADVMFTFVEIDDILLNNGFPPPWWYSSVDSILSFSILDAYTFEVLLDVKSVYAVMWSGGNVILPKHIWKPIAEGPTPDNYAADPNMIGSGPWRFQEYVGFSHVLLVKNSPGSTVTTNHPGAVPTTSTFGYFRYQEIQYQTVLFDGTTDRKLAPGATQVNVTIANKYLGGPGTVNISITIAGTPYLYPLTVIPAGDTFTHSSIEVLAYGTWPIIITLTYIDIQGTPITQTITLMFWVTITEDIAGSTFHDDIGLGVYPHKSQLPTPDAKDDIKDVALAAKGFGSYPGHDRWSAVADINGDYQIDIRDIAAIAKKYGWVG